MGSGNQHHISDETIAAMNALVASIASQTNNETTASLNETETGTQI